MRDLKACPQAMPIVAILSVRDRARYCKFTAALPALPSAVPG
jgi:hypothetical protein